MASATSLPKANSAFSLALLKQLSNNKTGNIFFSLFSISSALAMVMLGARGNTATQMSECLQAKDCWGDVHSSFAKLLTELNRPEALFTFTVANRLYREKSCPFTQKFLIQSKKHYSTELESVDFKTRSEEVRIDVNNWMQQHTPGKMQTCYIDVRLPRFTLEETYDLNTVLSSMSMVDVFDHTKCDFSGMSGHKDLVLSKVIHKAFVKVHEKATEATFEAIEIANIC
ncbi:unnamed protein product [Oreochromis niloticus]|nr:unnamed protein product [Mustela putorius furo]